MSQFEVKVIKISSIEPIEGADSIESVVVGDYRSVSVKGIHKVGELAVYIPTGAIVPNEILVSIGLEGKLAGRLKNRVKAIRLRGCLSEGILLPVTSVFEPEIVHTMQCWDANGKLYSEVVQEGNDVANLLNITKYEPILPTSMSGDVYYAGTEYTVRYDVENYKKYPDIIQDGEEVVMTEKLHGTCFGIGLLPESDHDPKHIFGRYVLFSKGIGAQGLAFKLSPKTESTVYLRAAEKFGLFDALDTMQSLLNEEDPAGFDRPLFIMGEVFGGNIQDAGWYSNELSFRMFDVASGYNAPGLQNFFSYDAMVLFGQILHVPVVPLLYRGPFSKELMLTHASGKETISGNQLNIREGCVVKPVTERKHPRLGRMMVKCVSEEYLLRKGDVKEYQ